jgi:hypothetical protein
MRLLELLEHPDRPTSHHHTPCGLSGATPTQSPFPIGTMGSVVMR